MKPVQKIKWLILAKLSEWDGSPLPAYPMPEIDTVWNELDDLNIYDAKEEVRNTGVPTHLPSQDTRYYDCKEVAAQLPDGSWVGWSFFYGGGKHGEPNLIPWMDSAYDVECKEEQKLVTVRTFSNLE